MSQYSTQYMNLLKEAYDDYSMTDGIEPAQDDTVSMLQKKGFTITKIGKAEYGPGGKIVYMTRRKGGSMAVVEVDSDGMVNDQTPADYLADILGEGAMCEHHDEEKFPQELLGVSIEKMLDLMEEQAEGDEEVKEFYEKVEQWLIDNEKELIPEAKENEEEEEEEEEEAPEEVSEEPEMEEVEEMTEAATKLPYKIVARIPSKLLRINFASDWGGEWSTLVFNTRKDGIPAKKWMTTYYDWTEDGNEVKFASMKGGELVGNTLAAIKIIEDLDKTFDDINQVYVRQITENDRAD